jgi:ATP synthase protein I
MPQPDESHDAARQRLDARLQAFEAERAPKTGVAAQSFMGDGYRFLGEVVGGVFGGAGFGWLFDRFVSVHTAPAGLIGGLLIGTGLSIFVAMRQAARMTSQSAERAGPSPAVAPDEEND